MSLVWVPFSNQHKENELVPSEVRIPNGCGGRSRSLTHKDRLFGFQLLVESKSH
jgi:hypothetical protein